MRLILVFISCGLLAAQSGGPSTPQAQAQAQSQSQGQGQATDQRLRADITYLAGPETRGRGQGSQGLEKAAQFLVQRYRDLGLKVEVQRYTSPGPLRRAEAVASLSDGKALRWDSEIQLLRPLSVSLKHAPLVFGGCGIRSGTRDDFAGQDLEHAVAVLIQNPSPAQVQGIAPEDSSLALRILEAERAGASAVLLLEQPNVPMVVSNSPALAMLQMPVFSMKLEAFATHVKGAAPQVVHFQPGAAAFGRWGSMEAQVTFKPSEVSSANVVAYIPGTDPVLANQYVALGAHFDHLGDQASFASLALGEERAKVHPGADDNASGTAMVLDLARRLKAHPLKRSILLMHFSGEELGLLGSAHWVKHPTVPLESVAFFFCFDMVGRLNPEKPFLFVGSVGATRDAVSRIDACMSPSLRLQHDLGMILGSSDHASFAKNRIPTVFFTTGLHDDYHRPTDTAGRINVAGEALIEEGALAAIHGLADMDRAPDFDADSAWFLLPRTLTPMTVDFGALPSSQMDPRGLLLAGCQDASPAAHAGLKAGDVLVELGDTPIHSLLELEAAVKAHRPRETVSLRWIRDGRAQEGRAVLVPGRP